LSVPAFIKAEANILQSIDIELVAFCPQHFFYSEANLDQRIKHYRFSFSVSSDITSLYPNLRDRQKQMPSDK